jgi:hypothetical protein
MTKRFGEFNLVEGAIAPNVAYPECGKRIDSTLETHIRTLTNALFPGREIIKPMFRRSASPRFVVLSADIRAKND